MSDATPDGPLEEARSALDSGAPWRARDLLAAHVEAERDPEALALLGEVLHDMGDLPRAGAIWFAAGCTSAPASPTVNGPPSASAAESASSAGFASVPSHSVCAKSSIASMVILPPSRPRFRGRSPPPAYS